MFLGLYCSRNKTIFICNEVSVEMAPGWLSGFEVLTTVPVFQSVSQTIVPWITVWMNVLAKLGLKYYYVHPPPTINPRVGSKLSRPSIARVWITGIKKIIADCCFLIVVLCLIYGNIFSFQNVLTYFNHVMLFLFIEHIQLMMLSHFNIFSLTKVEPGKIGSKMWNRF